MLAEARPFLSTMPWWGVFPGIALALTVLGFNLFGDGLRDLLDPRLRSRLS
jgi:peptide/nickel transport system permease protein